MKTFALSYTPESEIAAWCRPDSGDTFECLNGAWYGSFIDGMVFIQGSTKGIPAVKRWEGEVPKEFSNNYNAAIQWIREQL